MRAVRPKLLVIRNDKIGDFMVCFPAFTLLKQALPEWEIVALVPSYTAPLAELCPAIDRVILDPSEKSEPSAQATLVESLKAEQFSAVISFVSTWYNAKLTWRARIPFRLAPATKCFQFLYNHRLVQRRSRSVQSEAAYNVDLAKAFLRAQGKAIPEIAPPFLRFSEAVLNAQREKLIAEWGLAREKKWIFVHSATGGSAPSLSLEQYAELLRALMLRGGCHIILTAGKGEAAQAQALNALLDGQAVVYDRNDGLADFTRSLACADLFIAGSTGPLHICGALNRPTIGFYPSRRSAHPRRWQPVNAPERHLAFCPPESPNKAEQMDLSRISIAEAWQKILPFVESIGL